MCLICLLQEVWKIVWVTFSLFLFQNSVMLSTINDFGVRKILIGIRRIFLFYTLRFKLNHACICHIGFNFDCVLILYIKYINYLWLYNRILTYFLHILFFTINDANYFFQLANICIIFLDIDLVGQNCKLLFIL